MSFKDLFSKQSGAYAKYRPRYPDEIFEFAWSLPKTLTPESKRVAWDCGTGNGQAALGLAKRFDSIIATDASEQQITQASPHPKVQYRVATAESSGLAAASVDLVNVAQSLHWFRIDEFFREARRVLRPGGALLVFGYEFQRVAPEVDPVVAAFHRIVGPYWPPERRLVETKLRTIDFPLTEVPSPQLEMVKNWTLAEFAGYVGTWSATQSYVEENGPDALEDLGSELARVWGDPGSTKTITFDLFSRAGLVSKQ